MNTFTRSWSISNPTTNTIILGSGINYNCIPVEVEVSLTPSSPSYGAIINIFHGGVTATSPLPNLLKKDLVVNGTTTTKTKSFRNSLKAGDFLRLRIISIIGNPLMLNVTITAKRFIEEEKINRKRKAVLDNLLNEPPEFFKKCN